MASGSRPIFHFATATLAVVTALALGACGGGEGGEEAQTPVQEVGDTLSGDRADTGGGAPPPGRTADPDGEGPLPAWTTGVVEEAGGSTGAAEIRSFDAGRHEEYDRVVVEFADGALPGFQAEYVDRPLHECGSGQQVHPVGDGWLQVRMEPARGHTEAGQPTLQRERATADLPLVTRIYRTCDFEAVVTLVLAVESPNPFRVFTLREPARLVVDVRR